MAPHTTILLPQTPLSQELPYLSKNTDGILCFEDLSLVYLFKKYGSPLYIYSQTLLEDNIKNFQKNLNGLSYRIHYAMKANDHSQIIKLIHQQGCQIDAVSGGELAKALHAQIPAKDIILSGVAKTSQEIQEGLQAGVFAFVVESAQEALQIAKISHALHQKASIILRINPDIDPQTHPYISTGLQENKFGIACEDLPALLKEIQQHPSLKCIGISCHIGSQILTLEPFEQAARRMLSLWQHYHQQYPSIQYLGMGGGIGIAYRNEKTIHLSDYASMLKQIFSQTNTILFFEPGRSFIGQAGVLLMQVIREKKNAAKRFVLVDCGMSHFLRPALYQAQHTILMVQQKDTKDISKADIVGPICESSDYLLHDALLPQLKEGDLLLLLGAGAYGAVMSNNYNGHTKAAEILISKKEDLLISQRQNYQALWQWEQSEVT